MVDRVFIWFADNGNIRKWQREKVAATKLPIPPRKRPMFAKEATNDA